MSSAICSTLSLLLTILLEYPYDGENIHSLVALTLRYYQ
jgi:hypothetical protein